MFEDLPSNGLDMQPEQIRPFISAVATKLHSPRSSVDTDHIGRSLDTPPAPPEGNLGIDELILHAGKELLRSDHFQPLTRAKLEDLVIEAGSRTRLSTQSDIRLGTALTAKTFVHLTAWSQEQRIACGLLNELSNETQRLIERDPVITQRMQSLADALRNQEHASVAAEHRITVLEQEIRECRHSNAMLRTQLDLLSDTVNLLVTRALARG